MTVNLSIRNYQVVVAGLNCTDGITSFRGSDSKLDQSGLVTFKGELVIGKPLGFESLDDRRNDRWSRGNTVTIKIADSSGVPRLSPRGGTLKILSSSYAPATRKLTLQLGDQLELLRFREPNGDASKICLGTSVSRTGVVNTLLAAAGCPALVGSSIPGSLSAPTPKLLEGSYIDQAAAIAAAAGYVLYVDSAGLVRCTPINIKQSSPVMLVGNGAIVLAERVAGEQPPCNLIVKGKASIVRATQSSTSSFIEETGPAFMAGAQSKSTILTKRIQKVDTFDRGSKTRRIETKEQAPVGLLLPDDKNYYGKTDLINSEFKREIYTYEQNSPVSGDSASTHCEQGNKGRLKTYESYTYQLRGVVLRDVLSTYPQRLATTKNAIPLNKTALMVGEYKITTYEYNDGAGGRSGNFTGTGNPDDFTDWQDEPLGSGPRIVTRVFNAVGAIDPADFKYSAKFSRGDPTRLVESDRLVQYWRELSAGEWEADKTEYKSLILVSSTAADKLRALFKSSNKVRSFASSPLDFSAELTGLTTSSSEETISNSGQAQPPAPDTYPAAFTTKDVVVKGRAILPTNAESDYRQVKKEMDFQYLTGVGKGAAQSEADNLAKLWGVLLWGRSKATSYTTDLNNSWWNYAPGARVDVQEDEAKFSYLGDGFCIAMAGKRCVVSFDGLYMGEVRTVPAPPNLGGSGGGSSGGGSGGGEGSETIEVIIPPYKRVYLGEFAGGSGAIVSHRNYSTEPHRVTVQAAGGSAIKAINRDAIVIKAASGGAAKVICRRRSVRAGSASAVEAAHTIRWSEVDLSLWRGMTALQWRLLTR